MIRVFRWKLSFFNSIHILKKFSPNNYHIKNTWYNQLFVHAWTLDQIKLFMINYKSFTCLIGLFFSIHLQANSMQVLQKIILAWLFWLDCMKKKCIKFSIFTNKSGSLLWTLFSGKTNLQIYCYNWVNLIKRSGLINPKHENLKHSDLDTVLRWFKLGLIKF